MNNSIDNLRDVSLTINQWNRNIEFKDGKYPGVSYEARTGKWYSRIYSAGKGNHLGTYETPELAYAAWLTAKELIHKGYK